MGKDSELIREFWSQEKRFERAKRKTQKHIRLAEAWKIVMDQAVAEQHRINKELRSHDQEDEP